MLVVVLADCKSTEKTAVNTARFDSPEVTKEPFHFKVSVGIS